MTTHVEWIRRDDSKRRGGGGEGARVTAVRGRCHCANSRWLSRRLVNLRAFAPECQVFQAIPQRVRAGAHEVGESRNKSCRHFRGRVQRCLLDEVFYSRKCFLPRKNKEERRGENSPASLAANFRNAYETARVPCEFSANLFRHLDTEHVFQFR